jgi:hypothetical protein
MVYDHEQNDRIYWSKSKEESAIRD